MAAEAEKAKELRESKDASEGSEIGAAMKCSYTLTVNSLSAFPVSLDTRRQDRAVALKAEWEQDKGRAERAKSTRDKYLTGGGSEEQDLGAKDPSKGRRPTVKGSADQALARVMTAEERAERLERHEKELEDYKKGHDDNLEARKEYASQWRDCTEGRSNTWDE